MRTLWDYEKANCSEEGSHDEGDPSGPSPAKVRLCNEAPDVWLARSKSISEKS